MSEDTWIVAERGVGVGRALQLPASRLSQMRDQSPEPDAGSSPGVRESQRKAGLPLGPCGWREEKGPQGTCSIVPGPPVSTFEYGSSSKEDVVSEAESKVYFNSIF